jgi:hypothetical protein
MSLLRDDAKRDSLEAISLARQGHPRDFDDEAEAVSFDVSVVPAA